MKTIKSIVALSLTLLLLYQLIPNIQKVDFQSEQQEVKISHNATQGEGYGYKRSRYDYPEGVIKGRQAIRKEFNSLSAKKRLKNAGLKKWDFMGPANIGGKVKSIALVPRPDAPGKEDIILGTSSGGIWKSVDDGSSWFPVNDFLASLSITHIIVHPNNPDSLYAATGDGFGGIRNAPGAGIFLSTDRGNSWAQLSSTDNQEFMYTNRLTMDPNNPKKMLSCTTTEKYGSSGKIWHSLNGGQSWNSSGFFDMGIVDLKMDPNNSNIVLAGGTKGAFRSVNGGISFSPIYGGSTQLPLTSERVEFAFAPSNSGLVYASIEKDNGELWKSTDSGLNWVPVNTGNALLIRQGWHNNALFVDPSNSNNIILGGVEAQRSTNGGISFTLISNSSNYHNGSAANSIHADQHVFMPSLFYWTGNPKVYIGNDGGIQMTNDIWNANASSGWTNLANTSLGNTQVIGAAVSKNGVVYSAGTQDNSFHTGSSTSNWFQWSTGDGGHCAIDQTNQNIIYNTIHSSIYKSVDGGANYNFIRHVDHSSYGFPFGMDRNNSQILIACEEFLWASTDGGSNWVKAKQDSVVANNSLYDYNVNITSFAAQQSMSELWVGYSNGHIERRIAPGLWSGALQDQGNMPDETVTGIAINPSNPNEIFVSFAGYHTNNIWYSPNKGASWFNKSLSYPMQVNDISWHPQNSSWVYIGTDYGVIASEDKGDNWALYPIYPASGSKQSHDGPVYTQIYQLFWQGDGSDLYPYYLCAASFGRGIWRTSRPVLNEVYIKKDCFVCGLGTMSAPYATLRQALSEAGLGSTLVFLSSGIHNEIPSYIFSDGRYKIKVQGASVIIE